MGAIIRVREQLGEWPMQAEYIEHKHRRDPGHMWVYRRSDEFDDWQDAIDAAQEAWDEAQDAGDSPCIECGRSFVAAWDAPLCGGCR